MNTSPKKYGWNNNQAEASHSYLVPGVLSLLHNAKGKKLIDIGVGNGSLLPVWHEQGYDISAFEPDSEGYKFALSNKFADVRQLGLGEGFPREWEASFDVAICLEVVEHLFNAHVLPEACRYLLKKEGVLIVSTPYHGYLKNLALSVFNKWDFHHHPVRVGGHVKFWSKKTIVDLFDSHGFELVEFKGVGRVPFVWKSMILVFKPK